MTHLTVYYLSDERKFLCRFLYVPWNISTRCACDLSTAFAPLGDRCAQRSRAFEFVEIMSFTSKPFGATETMRFFHLPRTAGAGSAHPVRSVADPPAEA